ncbi:MAG: DUF433 domain-containing protein [Fimbriimonas sp.]
MIIPPGLEGVLSIDHEVMHGELCFRGTRVPLTVFLDNLAEGMGVDEFVEEYPSVTRDQALVVVGWQQHQTKQAAGLAIAAS